MSRFLSKGVVRSDVMLGESSEWVSLRNLMQTFSFVGVWPFFPCNIKNDQSHSLCFGLHVWIDRSVTVVTSKGGRWVTFLSQFFRTIAKLSISYIVIVSRSYIFFLCIVLISYLRVLIKWDDVCYNVFFLRIYCYILYCKSEQRCQWKYFKHKISNILTTTGQRGKIKDFISLFSSLWSRLPLSLFYKIFPCIFCYL